MDVQITCTQTERKNEWEIGDREKKIVTVCPHAIINSFYVPTYSYVFLFSMELVGISYYIEQAYLEMKGP